MRDAFAAHSVGEGGGGPAMGRSSTAPSAETPGADSPVPIPDASCWPGLPPAELAYRESVLRDIRKRVQLDGEHAARPHPDRARQFMPFAALKGYHEMAASKERVPEPRREMTEERALSLSQRIAALRRGDVVRVVHYEGGAYAETVGAVSEVVEAYRMLRIVRKPIPFDDLWEVEGL